MFLIVFDKLRETQNSDGVLSLCCYQRCEFHFYTWFVFFYSSDNSLFYILSLISFIFVAYVPGYNKFFEPYTSGSMFLVKVL